MNILITGGTGLIGRHLSEMLLQRGDHVTILSRSHSDRAGLPVAVWDPAANKIDDRAVADSDVIIHLAGTNISGGRWTNARKKSITESRVNTSRLLYESVLRNSKKPRLFISASGVGYYGAVTSDHIFTESDPPGKDFLAHTCHKWEKAAESFTSIGVRTVILRQGLVLTAGGGLLHRLNILFKLGFGIVLGKGNQYLPWIHISDLCKMYIMGIENENLKGVYNAVAPDHITFRDFAHIWASVIGKKLWLPAIPPVLLKLVFGEMSETILTGSRVSDELILQSGYRFSYPSLKSALDQIFKKPGPSDTFY